MTGLPAAGRRVGRSLGPGASPGGGSVKAATYHGLQIAASPDDGGYAVTLVFDA